MACLAPGSYSARMPKHNDLHNHKGQERPEKHSHRQRGLKEGTERYTTTDTEMRRLENKGHVTSNVSIRVQCAGGVDAYDGASVVTCPRGRERECARENRLCEVWSVLERECNRLYEVWSVGVCWRWSVLERECTCVCMIAVLFAQNDTALAFCGDVIRTRQVRDRRRMRRKLTRKSGMGQWLRRKSGMCQ
jgi:hypothetical protein